jgi:Ca2+-binding RTX toxin-like protein
MKKSRILTIALTSVVLVAASAAFAANRTGSAGPDVLFGTPQNDTIVARAGNDTAFARAGNDTVRMNDGDDRAFGGLGNDYLRGGRGNDVLQGNDGNDLIRGRTGNDEVRGHAGEDNLYGGWGTDTLYGGESSDVLHAMAFDGQLDVLDCGAGNDTAFVRASEGPFTVVGTTPTTLSGLTGQQAVEAGAATTGIPPTATGGRITTTAPTNQPSPGPVTLVDCEKIIVVPDDAKVDDDNDTTAKTATD